MASLGIIGKHKLEHKLLKKHVKSVNIKHKGTLNKNNMLCAINGEKKHLLAVNISTHTPDHMSTDTAQVRLSYDKSFIPASINRPFCLYLNLISQHKQLMESHWGGWGVQVQSHIAHCNTQGQIMSNTPHSVIHINSVSQTHTPLSQYIKTELCAESNE